MRDSEVEVFRSLLIVDQDESRRNTFPRRKQQMILEQIRVLWHSNIFPLDICSIECWFCFVIDHDESIDEKCLQMSTLVATVNGMHNIISFGKNTSTTLYYVGALILETSSEFVATAFLLRRNLCHLNGANR